MKHVFIVNPYAGSMTFANNLRQKLEHMDGFEYFLFNSRHTGNETELTRKIIDFFPQERLRIYACGGSGTLRNVYEGIGENENVELAFYPCGMTNDLLKCFAPEDRERFYDIEELIGGETIRLDSILTNHGRVLNTFSCGLDATIMQEIARQHPVRTVGIRIPYTMHIFQSMLHMKKMDLKIRIDGKDMSGMYDELCFANGCTLSGSLTMPHNYAPADGVANFVLIPSRGLFAFVRVVFNLLSQNETFIDANTRAGKALKMTLKRSDGAPIIANLDGETVEAQGEWTLELRPDSVCFVVPRGVRLP